MKTLQPLPLSVCFSNIDAQSTLDTNRRFFVLTDKVHFPILFLFIFIPHGGFRLRLAAIECAPIHRCQRMCMVCCLVEAT